MSDVELYYFSGRGLAEITRILLTVADIQYKEVNLKTRDDYVNLLPDLLFQQLPLVRIDGMNLVQSGAIARYISGKAKLLGGSAAEAARIDMLYEGTRDFLKFFLFVGLEPGDKLAEIKEKAFPRYLQAFNKVLLESSSGYLVGSRLSLADLGLFEVLLATVDYFTDEPINEYPKLKAFYETMQTNEKIAKYISSVRKPKNDATLMETVRQVFSHIKI